MASRYWKQGWNYGYAGTNNEDEVDACEYLGITEAEVAEADQEEVRRKLVEMTWDMAVEQVDAWVEPKE